MHFYGTIGPACASAGTLRRLVDAGMTGLRMNLSHDKRQTHIYYNKVYTSHCFTTLRFYYFQFLLFHYFTTCSIYYW